MKLSTPNLTIYKFRWVDTTGLLKYYTFIENDHLYYPGY